MSRSFEIPAGRRAFLAAALTALVLGLGAPCAQSQRRVELISFTNTTWRFEASGVDQGVAWRARTFDDTSWPSGRGLFGFETTPEVYPFPFNTVFDPFNPNILTYYFRTHFEMPASDLAFPLTLICSNLVDDGCIVYLNSNVVQSIRVPATGGQAAEGVIEGPVNISTNGLRVGDNVLAVEVHQAGPGSADVAFGLSLTAIVPTALSITNQPQSQTTTAGMPVFLSVGVAGGPALYQWQRKDGSGAFVNVPGVTSSSFTHTPTTAGTVTFQVVISNGVNSVTSDPATVTTSPDTFGPRMLSAAVLEEPTRTNRIRIVWNEGLHFSTVTFLSVSNFQVVMLPSSIQVAVSSVAYNPGTSPFPGILPSVTLTVSTTNWHLGSNYFVNVNRVRDSAGNVVAPDSRIPVSWSRNTRVIQPGHIWSFHSSAFFEPDIFEQPWNATNFVESSFWGSASGPFCSGIIESACLGPFCNTDIGFQPQPSLFRTTFVLPMNPGSPSQLRFFYIVDGGAAFYLNGKELFRSNLPGGPLTAQSKATVNLVQASCITNIILDVTNILPGTNWLAAAVFDSSPTDARTAFHAELIHSGYFPGEVPEVPVPRLNIAAEGTNRFRLWWDGPGYALESTTNLVFTNGGALGAWLEVTNMSNPFIDVLNGERRFFRLRQ